MRVLLLACSCAALHVRGPGKGMCAHALQQPPLPCLCTQYSYVHSIHDARRVAVHGAGGGWSLWDSGEWWMLLAAQSMAVGTVMVRWVAKYADPVVATGWHMVLGGLPLLALAVAQEGGEIAPALSQLTSKGAARCTFQAVP